MKKSTKKSSVVKQINLLGQIDHIDENGIVIKTEEIEWNYCEICGKSIMKGDICSTECGDEWINKFFPQC